MSGSPCTRICAWESGEQWRCPLIGVIARGADQSPVWPEPRGVQAQRVN
jgi:hypothetical protein